MARDFPTNWKIAENQSNWGKLERLDLKSKLGIN
jgi:hypothetical protein